MKILLLGGMTGMLAYDLEKAFQYEGIEYLPIARKSLSMQDEAHIRTLIKDYMPTHVINTIAFTQVDEAEEKSEEAYVVNVLFTRYLAKICSSLDIELIHYSTDFVFDGNTHAPYRETDYPNPLNMYGKTKYEGEREILTHCMKLYIIRTAWLFGIAKENFITKILQRVQESGSLHVVADQYGCPTYTKELAYATLPFLQDTIEYGIYHITNTGEASWFALAHYAVQCYNALCRTKYTIVPTCSADFPQKAKRPQYSVLNTQHYSQQTRRTLPHWRESVEEFVHYYVKEHCYNG